MEGSRLSKPLRCTSLHQSTIPDSPSNSYTESVIDENDLDEEEEEEECQESSIFELRRPSTTRRSIASDSILASSPEQASFLAELPGAIARARKVHYRREALVPKTKSFKRVQESLKEDATPFEADIKKEATLARILKQKSDEGLPNAPVPMLAPPLQFENPFDLDMPVEESIPGRTTKRTREDVRYEPYSHKRRAVSPSPASPLGSPSVAKTSIFRISDLNI